MGIFSVLRTITGHPLTREKKWQAINRFLKWQISSRLTKFPIVYHFTERSKLIISRKMTGATGNLYCGLLEFYDMSFLLHFLREEDSFIDIGANVGSYTVLASGHIGAKSYCFEPVPQTFKGLNVNIAINNIEEKVHTYNQALGSSKGTINFTSSLDTMNHVATKNEENTITVEVSLLDELLPDVNPALLKIDVEGFETEVLKGAKNTIAKSNLRAIIIELNGCGKKYGYDETEIHTQLLKLGFHPYTYNPYQRLLTSVNTYGKYNTIYIRDISFVNERLTSSKSFTILDTEI